MKSHHSSSPSHFSFTFSLATGGPGPDMKPGKHWQADGFVFPHYLVQIPCHCQNISLPCRHVGNNYKLIIKFLLTHYEIKRKPMLSKLSMPIKHKSLLSLCILVLTEIARYVFGKIKNHIWGSQSLSV